MSHSLKALAADKDCPGVKKTDLFRVDPHILVEEEGFNLRDYNDPDTEDSIEAFKESYMAGRYVPPLVVHVDDEGRVTIIEGHKRRRGALRAIKAGAEIAFLDCVQFKGNAPERVEVMLRSSDGQPFKPLETAFGYLRLSRWGYSNVQIAEKMNKTAARVEQLLLLATANPDVHELVHSKAVSADTAIDAIREHGEKAGEFLNGHLATAKAQGKTKVTKSAIRGWAPPRQMVSGLVATVSRVSDSLDQATRVQLAEMESLGEEQIKGRKVEVEASVLLELLRV